MQLLLPISLGMKFLYKRISGIAYESDSVSAERQNKQYLFFSSVANAQDNSLLEE
jgi:hypothetical protein